MQLLNMSFSILSKLKKAYRDINQFNSVEKSYLLAQLIFIVASTILPTVLPVVVNTITGKAATVGIISAISTWAILVFTFFSGNILKLFSMRKFLIGQSFIQTLLYLIITFLLFTKLLTIPLLILILVVSGIFFSLSELLETDKSGSNRIFSSAAKKETALYVFNLFFYISMIIVPILFGIVIDSMGKHIGIEKALAIAYFIFCFMMLSCAIIYLKNVYPSKDILINLNENRTLRKTLLFKAHRNMWDATKIVWRNQALRLRFILASIEAFVYMPFSIVVLPTLAMDILHRGATGNGLLLGAMNAGAMIATLSLLSGKQLQKKYGFYRYIFWLALLSSCAFIPSILFWEYPILWVAIPAALCVQFFLEPLRGRLELLVQLEINSDEKAKTEELNIFGLLELISKLGSSIGCIIFGFIFLHSSSGTWLYHLLGSYAALKIVTLLLGIYGLINIVAIIWFKRHVYHTYPLGYISEEEALQQLQDRLQHEHLSKPLLEVFHTPIPETHPTIALLASATDDHISQARADKTPYSRNIHLVLDSAWILEALQEDGTHKLYLKKGLYFDREGDPILAEYKIPRLIHYFANFYNPADPLNLSAVSLENRLDTPMSGSLRLQDLINESLLMRIWLSSRGILAPITCAFLMPEHRLIHEITAENEKQLLTTFIVAFPVEAAKQREAIRQCIVTFLALYQGREVVIKPSGSGIVPPEGVKFFTTDAIEPMIDHIIELSTHRLMTASSAILIEEYFHPPALYLQYDRDDRSGRYCILDKPTPLHILTREEIAIADDSVKKEWVVHVLAARTPWGKCLTTGFIARADEYGRPLTKAAAIIPFENIITALRNQHGLFTKDEDLWLLEKEIDHLATQVLLAIDEEQKKYPPVADDPLQAQVDYFGLDLIFLLVDGVLKPKIIAFHDHTVGRQYQFDKVYPEQIGEHSKIWFATMFSKARQNACKAKRLILVGAGDETRRPFLECANKLSIEIILLDKEDSWAKNLVSEFFVIHKEDLESMRQQALLHLSHSIQSFGSVDGISTYCAEHIMLTAELARDLNLPYLSMSNARTTTNRLKIQTTLSAAGLTVPLFFHVEDENTLDIALHQINRIEHTTSISRFPMVVKPLFKSKRIVSIKVNSTCLLYTSPSPRD